MLPHDQYFTERNETAKLIERMERGEFTEEESMEILHEIAERAQQREAARSSVRPSDN